MSPAASTPSTESLFRLGLNDALPISDEATTSRVVVNNEILRTVIFTFDTGQLLTEHTSPRAVIVTLLEGEMDFSIGERTERMGAGDVIYLAPGERHALTAVSPCRMQLVMVDVDKAGTTTTKYPRPGEAARRRAPRPADRDPAPGGGARRVRLSAPPLLWVPQSHGRIRAPVQASGTAVNHEHRARCRASRRFDDRWRR